MVYRIVKSVWNLLLFYVLAYLVASIASNSIDAIVCNDFVFENTQLYHQFEPVFGAEALVGFQEFLLFKTEMRTLLIFGVIVLLYSIIMVYNQRDIMGKKISWIVYNKPKSFLQKIMTFNKPTWFLILSYVTLFIPMLILFVIMIIAKLVFSVIMFVLSILIYPISQVLLAINGTVK